MARTRGGSNNTTGRGGLNHTSGRGGSNYTTGRVIITTSGYVLPRRGSGLRRSQRTRDRERTERERIELEAEQSHGSSERTVSEERGAEVEERGPDVEECVPQGDEMEAEIAGDDGEAEIAGDDGEAEEEDDHSQDVPEVEAERADGNGDDEDRGGDEMETEGADDPSQEVMQPEKFRIEPTEWLKVCKIATRCNLRGTVEFLETVLDEWELDWFTNHRQFRHLFHMPRHDNRKLMGMWMMLLRTVETKKKKECWFVVNGVPIRYSLTEHALLSGLSCKLYPKNYERLGHLRLIRRCFPGRKEKVDVKDIRSKLENMESANGEDRLKLAVLYFLSTIIKMKRKIKDGYIEPFLLKIVDNLRACETFPWGRYSFLNMIDQVDHLFRVTDGNNGGKALGKWTIPGFILPLEVLAYECIPQLGNRFRVDVADADASCPRLCKRRFTQSIHKGSFLREVYEALGTTKDIRQLVPTEDEVALLENLVEANPEDDEIDVRPDSWTRVLALYPNGICWKELYDQDVATRDELEQELPAEVEEATKTIDEKIEALKKEMDDKLKEMQDTYKKKLADYKAEMKKQVKKIVRVELRKCRSRLEKGGTSRENEDREEAEEVAENMVDEEIEDLDPGLSEDEHTPMSQLVKRRRLAKRSRRG